MKLTKAERRASVALRNFRLMTPTLSGFARALTGREDVNVRVATGGPITDGDTIFVPVPIELGDDLAHAKSLCDRRDADTHVQKCPACAMREDLIAAVCHEISHIAFGTFLEHEVGSTQMRKAFESSVGILPEHLQEQATGRYEELRHARNSSYMIPAQAIHEFLPVLVNGVEDARVDGSMFEARPGTYLMRKARINRIFTEGVEGPSGTVYWKDKPANSQVIIAIYLSALDLMNDEWFTEPVLKALKDEKLSELISESKRLSDSLDSYNLSIKMMSRLWELGFCNPPPPPPEEQKEDDNEDSDEDEDQEDGEESGDSEGESSEGDSGDPSGGVGDGEHEGEDGPGDGQERERVQDSDGEPEEGDSGDKDQPGGGSGSGDRESEEGAESPEQGTDEVSGDAGDEQDSSDSSGEEDHEDSDESGGTSREGDLSEEGSGGGSDPEEQLGESQLGADDGESDGGSGDNDDADQEGDERTGGADGGSDHSESSEDSQQLIHSGTAEDALDDLEAFTYHGELDGINEGNSDEQRAIKLIEGQGDRFDELSHNITAVNEHEFHPNMNPGRQPRAWANGIMYKYQLAEHARSSGVEAGTNIPESILGPALLHMRRVFADNARAAMQKNLRSGKINARSLGKRAWAKDDRLFQKKRLPGKRSYAVLIGLDVSGSTAGVEISLIKRAAMAQAELCSRLGIEFAVYAHTGEKERNELTLEIYKVKKFDQPWDDKARAALDALGPANANLDGHTLEYYRKEIEHHPATDKIILYYSDGAMPCENYSEELDVLYRNLKLCKNRQITLLGVGIMSDAPREYGMSTVQVDRDEDISLVVKHLEGELSRTR